MGSKMETNRKVLIRYCLVGAILGYAIFHPLIMLLSNMMATTDTVSNMTDSFDFLDVVMQSFSIAMLPWSLSFALFNGVIGLYYGTIKVEKKKREEVIVDLQKALAEVKKLSGMLPICSSCKKIRDDEGYWQQIEEYIKDHSEADFTHGICEECVKKLYPEFYTPFKKRMKLGE
jgi:hypothetical protein